MTAEAMMKITIRIWMPSQSLRQNDRFFLTGGPPEIRFSRGFFNCRGWGIVVAWPPPFDTPGSFAGGVARTGMRLATTAYSIKRARLRGKHSSALSYYLPSCRALLIAEVSHSLQLNSIYVKDGTTS